MSDNKDREVVVMKKVCCQAEIHNSYLILMTYVLSKYNNSQTKKVLKNLVDPTSIILYLFQWLLIL